jgi:putrescine transport system substrate-binding protein
MAFLLALAGCGGAGGSGESAILNVYNWSDYIAPETIRNFEAETGIKVVYDVFDSNDLLEAKLLSGGSGYDIVVPTSEFLARQILAGVFQPLDRSKLPNYGNLDPELMKLLEMQDPGNRYAVPYLWGTNGIGYNVDQVRKALGPDAPLDSFDLIFKPEYAARLAACGIALLDAPRDVLAVALQYQGLDPNSDDPDLYRNQAKRVLDRVRPYIRYFHSSQFVNDLANGQLCVAYGYSGDILQAGDRAREARNGVNIGYSIPKEGTIIFFDMMAIPAAAPHADNAHLFIDYLLRPEVIAAVSNFVKYPNPNRASLPLIDAEVLSNPTIYPPAEVRRRLFILRVAPPKIDRVANRVWTAVKSGS